MKFLCKRRIIHSHRSWLLKQLLRGHVSANLKILRVWWPCLGIDPLIFSAFICTHLSLFRILSIDADLFFSSFISSLRIASSAFAFCKFSHAVILATSLCTPVGDKEKETWYLANILGRVYGWICSDDVPRWSFCFCTSFSRTLGLQRSIFSHFGGMPLEPFNNRCLTVHLHISHS